VLGLRANRRLALACGLLLPLAEMVRRSSQLSQWWLWADDWLIGGALLAGAWVAASRPGLGARALAGAWGVAAGMGCYSFAGHLLSAGRADVSGLPGWALAALVGAGWLLALYALVSAVAANPD
jgi:hypothetical protein